MKRLDDGSDPAYPPNPTYAVYDVLSIDYRITNRSRHQIEVSTAGPTITFQAPPGLDRATDFVPPVRLEGIATVGVTLHPKQYAGHDSSNERIFLGGMDLKVVSGKPDATGVSIVWRYIHSDVGTTCNGDDKYRSTR